jgi:hypothetical protein
MGKSVASGAQRQAEPVLVAAVGQRDHVVRFYVDADTAAGTAAVGDLERAAPEGLLGAAGAPERDRAAPAPAAPHDQHAAPQTRALQRVPCGEIVGKRTPDSCGRQRSTAAVIRLARASEALGSGAFRMYYI